jgi:hypothetical protein
MVDNLQASGSGNVSAVIGGRVLTLEGCLYVLDLSQQLISLVQMIKSTITISKTDQDFTISQNDKVMFAGDV